MLARFPAGAGTREMGSKRKGKRGKEEFLDRKCNQAVEQCLSHALIVRVFVCVCVCRKNVVSEMAGLGLMSVVGHLVASPTAAV